MKKLVPVLAVLCFLSWLLPLGRFIDPSKEAKVCGGQRAICLCSHAPKTNKPLEGTVFTTTSSTSHEQSGFGSCHDFEIAKVALSAASGEPLDYFSNTSLYSLVLDRRNDSVPKA
jgi:hypothetical protein